MIKKLLLILAVGLVLGLVDIIPLFLANAPLFNMLAIIVFWLVAALMMARTSFVKNPWLDGLFMGVLLIAPLVLTVSAVNPKDFLPMLLMAVLLGPLCAWSLARLDVRST